MNHKDILPLLTEQQITTFDEQPSGGQAQTYAGELAREKGWNWMQTERALRRAANQRIKEFCNFHAYSDVHPYEVVRKVSATTVEVRAMTATEGDWKPEWHAGGFAGHCANQRAQKWEFSSNPSNGVFRVRWSKAKGHWQDKHGRRFKMSDEPHRFHDYNF